MIRLEFSIWLEEEDGESGKHLSLMRTRFLGRPDRPTVELSRKSYGFPPEKSFEWDTPQRALCFLFFQAFSSKSEPHMVIIHSSNKRFASSLYNVIRMKHAKSKPTEATWIVRMFTEESQVKEKLLSSGKIRLPPSFIKGRWIRSAKLIMGPEYTVQLGTDWRHAEFRAYYSNERKLCPPIVYKLLAQRLAERTTLKNTAEFITYIITASKAPEELVNNNTGLVGPHMRALQAASINEFEFVDIYEGSTKVVVRLTRADSDKLMDALLTESLQNIEVCEVALLEEDDHRGLRALLRPTAVSVDAGVPGNREKIARFCGSAYKIECLRRPWTRLQGLLSSNMAASQSQHVIAESRERTYSSVERKANLKSLRIDLAIGLSYYPALGAILIALSCLAASLFGTSTATLLGVVTGIGLATVGAQGCSMMISPLACCAGIIFVGWGFGLAQAIILGTPSLAAQPTAERILANPFLTIDGGLIGLTAPYWIGRLSWKLIGLLLYVTGAGIGLSGWLMAQPFIAARQYQERSFVRDLGGALLGALAGVFIPATMGLFKTLQAVGFSPPHAFSTAFGVTATLATSLVVWGQGKQLRRVIMCGGLQGGCAWLLSSMAFLDAGSTFSLLAVCMACAYFQSTWFACAFEIARKMSSPRAAVWATLLEGVIGYLAFVVLEAVRIV